MAQTNLATEMSKPNNRDERPEAQLRRPEVTVETPVRLRPRPVLALLPVLVVLGLASLLPAAPAPKKHPSLVDVKTAKCETCHAKVVALPEKHAAAEDCTNCHEVSKKDGQTQVVLVDEDPSLCLTCHDTFARFVAEGDKAMAGAHPALAGGCTSCHGPHSAEKKRLLSKAPSELCSDCHDADTVKTAHPVPLGRADCLSCHAVHGSPQKKMLVAAKLHPPFAEKSCDACHQRGYKSRRARRNPAQTCFACHDETAFQGKVVHGAVKKGQCTGCHDPHMSDRPRFLKAEGTGLCITCHGAIAAKMDLKDGSTHPPAKDDCTGCHSPHRSDVPRLLTEAVPALCWNCHEAKDKKLRAKHLGADLAKLDCVTCHDPHGSPSKHLLSSASIHSPFADGSCDSCHEAGKASKFVEKDRNALCATCHDVAENAKAEKVPHPALEASECLDCHSPHAARQQKLAKVAGAELCTACHSDQAAGEGEVAHGVIAKWGCQACHLPHGGENPRMLRKASVDALCIECHVTSGSVLPEDQPDRELLGRWKVSGKEFAAMAPLGLSEDGQRNHPVANHRVLGTPTEKEIRAANVDSTFKGEFHCTTCHDPHKGKSRQLFVKGAAGALDVCQQCHPK